jgi:hypothetical protein
LASIVAAGRIEATNVRQTRHFVNIANRDIQDRRAVRAVHAGPGGTLHDYVPFYFGPRSPMLYAIKTGFVPGYDGGQDDVIYLVSSTEAVVTAARPFVFTDGHAAMDYSEQFDDLGHLDKIDWPLMTSTYWSATNDDPDRKTRRQAEFLVYRFLPCSAIERIVSASHERVQQIRTILNGRLVHCAVEAESGWYY